MMRPQVQRQRVLSTKDKLQKMRIAFIDEMELNIKNSIKNILNKASKLEEKKTALLNVTRLPKGICSEADRKAAVKPGDVLKFVSSTEAKYRPVDFYKRFVAANFDAIMNNMKNQNGAQDPLDYSMFTFTNLEDLSSDSVSSLRTQFATVSVLSGSPMSGVEQEGVQERTTSQEETDDTEPSYATFTVSLSRILRKDLPDTIRDQFNKKVKDAMLSVSNFTSDLQFLTLCSISNFRDYTFEKSNNNRLQVKERNGGFELKSIFPPGFVGSENIEFSAPCLPSDLLNFESFCNTFQDFFTKRHLAFLYRCFFSEQGPRQQTLEKLSLQHAFNKTIQFVTREELIEEEHKRIPGPLKDIAFESFATNFENMWNNKKIINKLLNKLLDVLLKIHLSPIRESAYKEYIEAKKNEKEREHRGKGAYRANFGELSRDHQRLILRGIDYKLKKLMKKLLRLEKGGTKDGTKISNCKRQIGYCNNKKAFYATQVNS